MSISRIAEAAVRASRPFVETYNELEAHDAAAVHGADHHARGGHNDEGDFHIVATHHPHNAPDGAKKTKLHINFKRGGNGNHFVHSIHGKLHNGTAFHYKAAGSHTFDASKLHVSKAVDSKHHAVHHALAADAVRNHLDLAGPHGVGRH